MSMPLFAGADPALREMLGNVTRSDGTPAILTPDEAKCGMLVEPVCWRVNGLTLVARDNMFDLA